MYCKRITKADLIIWGFRKAEYLEDKDTWVFTRSWNCTRNPYAAPTEHEVKVSYTHDKHKYGLDYEHPVVSFSVRKKQYVIPLGRFLWAWVEGEVPIGYKIAHTGKDLSFKSFALKEVDDNSYRKINNQYTVNQISAILSKNFAKYDFCEAVERNIKILHKWADKSETD